MKRVALTLTGLAAAGMAVVGAMFWLLSRAPEQGADGTAAAGSAALGDRQPGADAGDGKLLGDVAGPEPHPSGRVRRSRNPDAVPVNEGAGLPTATTQEVLVRQYRTAPNPATRIETLRLLARSRAKEAVPLIGRALTNDFGGQLLDDEVFEGFKSLPFSLVGLGRADPQVLAFLRSLCDPAYWQALEVDHRLPHCPGWGRTSDILFASALYAVAHIAAPDTMKFFEGLRSGPARQWSRKHRRDLLEAVFRYRWEEVHKSRDGQAGDGYEMAEKYIEWLQTEEGRDWNAWAGQ